MKYLKLLTQLILCVFICSTAFAAPMDLPVKAELSPVEYTATEAHIALHFTIPNGWKVYSNNPGDSGLPIVIDFKGSKNLKSHDITWPPSELMIDKFGSEEMRTNVYKKDTLIPIKLFPQDPTKPITVNATLTYGACEKVCIGQDEKFNFSIEPKFVNTELKKKCHSAVKQCHGSHGYSIPETPFYMIVIFALVGGMILNLMPCVLPVLALKLLNIVKYAGLTKKQITLNLLATAFGIISTFILLAAVTIIFKIIGMNFGWGFQFQEPWFLIFIAVILTIFASNLWGEFEIALPQWLSDSASKTHKEYSINNSIAAGAFATLLATPCTAPFLSVSIAFALSQSEWMIMFIYIMVGVGMSIPYLLLAATPKTLTLLPKPGKWMVNLKKFFAILLVLTLVWVLYVLYYQISTYSLVILVGCLLLVKFVFSNSIQSKNLRILAIITVLISVIALPQIMERNVNENTTYQSSLWEPFSEEKLFRYISDEKTILVDITAEWCLICKGNKFFVLEQPDILKFLKDNNVMMMRGDYTNRSETLSNFLKKHNRPGIPFNIVYGPSNKKGIVLPEVLTKDILVDAIRRSIPKKI
jgi:suppressor for copper-sensitivity B